MRDPEVTLVEAVLRNAATALSRYLPPDAQPAAGTALIEAALAALEGHPGGDDAQLTLLRAIPGFAAGRADAERVLGWLDRPQRAFPVLDPVPVVDEQPLARPPDLRQVPSQAAVISTPPARLAPWLLLGAGAAALAFGRRGWSPP